MYTLVILMEIVATPQSNALPPTSTAAPAASSSTVPNPVMSAAPKRDVFDELANQSSAAPSPSATATEHFDPDAYLASIGVTDFQTGMNYYYGTGVEKDFAQAVKWLRKAAEKNYAPAQAQLGFCYANGNGVATDEAEAAKWYREAAQQNLAIAQYNLAISYRDGAGVRKDYAEAVKWFRKAAEQNDPSGQRELGLCYFEGIGLKKDSAQAAKWFRKAAEQNYPDAENDLGTCYANGQGVAKNPAEAARWFRKAAEGDLPVAQYNLAVCYEDGSGRPKDHAEAANWFRKAAEQDFAPAQAKLGFYYGIGRGVPKDEVEAYKWSLLAAAKGNDGAKRNVIAAEHTMSRYEIVQGQKLAREFKPRHTETSASETSPGGGVKATPQAAGTGFFVTEDGYAITNEHVVSGAANVRFLTSSGLTSAKIVQVDRANDLALLKADGKFAPLPVGTSRFVQLGSTVMTVGFPNIALQGFAPKFAPGRNCVRCWASG